MNIRMCSVYTNTGSYRCQDVLVSNCESCILLRLMFISIRIIYYLQICLQNFFIEKKKLIWNE